MSAKLMGQVFELVLTHAQQSLALAMADHGNDDGSSIRPGIDLLSWKTGYSERNVIRLLKELQRLGLIETVNGRSIGRGNVQEWRMNVTAVPRKAPLLRVRKGDRLSPFPEQIKDDSLSPYDELKGDKSDTQKVTSRTVKGDKSRSAHIVRERVEPSSNHQWEPSAVHEAAPEPHTPAVRMTAQRKDLQAAIVEATGRTMDFRMGTISPKFRMGVTQLVAKLERDGRTPDDAALFRERLPEYFGRDPETFTPPSPSQMLDIFDAVLNYDPKQRENNNAKRISRSVENLNNSLIYR